MGLEGDVGRINHDLVGAKRVYLADAGLTMTADDLVVNVTLTDANDSAVVLPSVAEAIGRIYVIRLVAVGSGAITVSDKADDAAFSDVTLNAAGESMVVYSDGEYWNEIQANYS